MLTMKKIVSASPPELVSQLDSVHENCLFSKHKTHFFFFKAQGAFSLVNLRKEPAFLSFFLSWVANTDTQRKAADAEAQKAMKKHSVMEEV